ncbi:MAG TPA: helix-hairpin-helix domain-containing protein [Chloroflexota bacterium]|nr:helix-hairpin-helix domain-containing protein [Chloroflexota bacterium]
MRNAEVARLFDEIAAILELQGDVPFRYNAYRTAARQIAALPEPIEEVAAAGRLERIPGVGKAIAAKITEYLRTGRLAYYDRLRAQVPPGLLELLRVPGLGPRTVQLLHRHLGVASLADLERAVAEQQVRTVPGLGARTEERLARELARLAQPT